MPRIICDSYIKDKQIFGDDINDSFNQKILAVNNMYHWLYEKGILEKEAFIFKPFPKGFAFAVDVKNLLPYRKEMEASQVPDAALAVYHIFDKDYSPCLYSGAIQLGWMMASYRDVDGCVGRSWECDLIKGLNTRSIYEINEVKEAQGVQAAVKAMFSYYIWPDPEKKASLSSQIDSAAGKADATPGSVSAPEKGPAR